MFLYKPKTEEQTDILIETYQMIIDRPGRGLFHLLFVHDHYRLYFITNHTDNMLWQKILRWADGIEIDNMNRIGKMIMYALVVGLFSYYTMCWPVYAFKVLINYKSIRNEAPLNLLKLG